MCSSRDKKANLDVVRRLTREAKQGGAGLVCFPEAFEFMGRPGTKDSLEAAELLTGPTMGALKDIAKEQNIWMSLGGFHERLAGREAEEAPGKIANTHCIINAHGDIVKAYRKIHLFDVDVDGGFRESDSTLAGDAVAIVKDTPVGTLGVTTCYDMRFPELYSILRDQGADVILAPSAFMPTTGKAHWHVLLRARAIETQTYVVAAAQTGVHNAEDTEVPRKRESFGHSLIVDPYGAVVCDLETNPEAIGMVDIDVNRMQEIRRAMPIPLHRLQSANVLASARAATNATNV
ncbi:Omega-amidase NIT2 [Hondaea fermentalgiana]|uniref:Omega-amidase NIT2 n=1 Tax=Hondaea fermentalgiana TaxID=2315210 RepID=A0A2R5G2E1_9STRA|nr:Omega-amidase NIT2 [Hondaea fermentalgiana]|eukprot:GBG24489.1 Omega-amidase NIT2 [Hondaea fermentalgiana]